MIPTLSLIVNNIDFTQPTDACYLLFPTHTSANSVRGQSPGQGARRQVPFMVGTDSGFAVTPYGDGTRA